MSGSDTDYSRGDRIPHRQAHENAGLAASSENYLSALATPNTRQLPIYRSFNNSNHHRIPTSHDAGTSLDHPLSAYNRTDGYRQHSIYNVNNQCLPPLPPSPNHYIIDSEEPFIPPPDSYLSPPGPAPPDRFQCEANTIDRFLHADSNFYLAPTSMIDRSSMEQIYHSNLSTNKYKNNAFSIESPLERQSEYYQTLPYSDSSRHSCQRRNLDYPNYGPLVGSSHYHQKSGLSFSTNKRILLYNQCQNVKYQKCCDTAPNSSDMVAQTYEMSCKTRARTRSRRISSPPVSLLAGRVAADFTNSPINSDGRYPSSFSASTLSRCSSFNDVESNPPAIENHRKISTGHESCCYRRHLSSSPSSVANPSNSSSYAAAFSTVSVSSTMSTSNFAYFQQPLTPINSNWKSVAANSNSTTLLSSHLQSNAPPQAEVSSNTSSSCNSNVNSPSLSLSSSSRSSPSLTATNTNNTTVSATTSPTATSSNSNNGGSLMEHHRQQVQRTMNTAVSEFDEKTTSSSAEPVDNSISSANDVLTAAHQPHSVSPVLSSEFRGSPESLPVQSVFERRNAKLPLQHQISAPVTATEVASSKRYRRSTSKKELIKNYIKKETAVFFGVHEPSEENERARWLDRRKRLAYRTYGKLKNEYHLPSAYNTLQKPDVLPLSSQSHTRSVEVTDERDAEEPRSVESTLKRKPSVARMTISGVAYVVSTLGKHKRRPSSTSRQWSRSYVPSSVPPTPSSPLDDEVFYDKSCSSSDECRIRSLETTISFNSNFSYEPTAISHGDEVDNNPYFHSKYFPPSQRTKKEKSHTWRRTTRRIQKDKESHNALCRLWSRFFDRILDNSDRRQYGMGVVGRMFGRSLKRSVVSKEPVKEQLEDLEDHRPFFTYWVTTVQILILALSVFAYGLGPIGFDLTQRSGLVLVTSLSLQQVEYSEPSNFWIGPRAADLIHMGAKFAPCMRKDKKIIKEIEKIRDRERETACCIRNDDSGCVQASQAECSKTISTWKKWSAGESGPGGRLSGSVCGLDPKFCEAPASVAPYEWPDDITKWPICRKMNSRFPIQMSPSDNHRYQKDKMTAEHMVCEVIGHPCCIGIHGTCRITTKEYCDFVHGYFHEEASLCSQVSCLDNVCGMIPFYFPEVPDQFYRLWTSLFIHAGILHLAVTVFVQYFLMRDLEKLTGAVRIAFIYIGSGVAGNLASAIFVPYRADVGPAGSQFGLLACLIVEVLNCWPMLKHPFQALTKLLLITFCLFLFGLLPWVDNFAHLFGFIFGFLLSYALLPFVSFGPYDRQKKIFLIWVCLMSSLFLFVLLVLLFYLIPIYDCEMCHYFNCIPLTRDFCATQNINFKREEYVV